MMLTEVISSIGEAGLAAVTGYAVVFFGIILLMAVVSIMGKIMQATQKKAAPAPVQAQNDAPAAQLPTAPGTAGIEASQLFLPSREKIFDYRRKRLWEVHIPCGFGTAIPKLHRICFPGRCERKEDPPRRPGTVDRLHSPNPHVIRRHCGGQCAVVCQL